MAINPFLLVVQQDRTGQLFGPVNSSRDMNIWSSWKCIDVNHSYGDKEPES